LAAIYIFYTIPLTLASTLVAPENLEAIMPEFFHWVNEWWVDFSAVVSGLMQSLIWTAFFASCPVIFKAIANFGSKATSVANAEFKALQYFWWFMLTGKY
jgi:Calcium-dependent channel, 7TM region, putative phosphate